MSEEKKTEHGEQAHLTSVAPDQCRSTALGSNPTAFRITISLVRRVTAQSRHTLAAGWPRPYGGNP